jgi:hypothetical protein
MGTTLYDICRWLECGFSGFGRCVAEISKIMWLNDLGSNLR